MFEVVCIYFLWQGSTNLEAIQIIKKAGGSLKDSFLDEGYGFIALLVFICDPIMITCYAPIQHDHLVATYIPNFRLLGIILFACLCIFNVFPTNFR